VTVLGCRLTGRVAVAGGLSKSKLRCLGSLVLACGDETLLPAGSGLAVDRELFAEAVTERIEPHPGFDLVREGYQGFTWQIAFLLSLSVILPSAVMPHSGSSVI